jgi:Ca2+-binding EF-hand superfamily protein
MGNLINPSSSRQSSLLAPLQESLTFLAKWKKITVKSFFNIYDTYFSPQTNLTMMEFGKILKHSQIEIYQDLVFKFFSNPQNKTINFLELLAVIVTYSMTDVEEKVELVMLIYDFDHSNKLSKDEMKIMCKCFLKGIKTATGNTKYSNISDENYLSEVFKNADSNFDGQIISAE